VGVAFRARDGCWFCPDGETKGETYYIYDAVPEACWENNCKPETPWGKCDPKDD
jgi:hypothetical protein